MTKSEIIQILMGFIGALCVGVLSNIRGKRLAAAASGALVSWALFILFGRIIDSEPMIYFIIACIMALYSEIMARVLKTPATPIIITSLIPLVPGGSLYYTMAYAFESDFSRFIEKAASTLSLAAALALGIIVVTAFSHFFFRRMMPKNKSKCDCSKVEIIKK